MKVVHIQNTMSKSGNAAFRLSSAMRKAGIDSYILNLSSTPEIENVFTLSKGRSKFANFLNKLNRYFATRGKRSGTYFYSPLPLIGCNIIDNKKIQEADVIYVHWVSGILSIQNLYYLINTKKPIIFYMHDMWDFTGGCHHSFECEQYKGGCDKCNMFAGNNSPSKQISALKGLYSGKKNIIFVSPSEWMADCARHSYAIEHNSVVCIPNIVDVDIFKQLDRVSAKKTLGLPLDKKIITFGCQAGTKNKFKGWDYLRDAVNRLQREDILVLIYGSADDTETRKQLRVPVVSLGKIEDEKMLATICNATDVFVSPSLAESFGLTFLENILCGTPVVGFDNTAICEIIKHKQNGYLAKNKDSNDLMIGINYVLDGNIVFTSDDYNPMKIVSCHLELIEKIRNYE